MATSTRLGPWLVGTNREGAGINLGATTVSQETTLTFPLAGEDYFAQLPAGACIQNVRVFSTFTATAAASAGSVPITFTSNSGVVTPVGNVAFAAVTAGTAGFTLYQLGTNLAPLATTATFWQNIGPVDGRLSFNTGLPAGFVWYVTTNYTVRNLSGSILRLP